MWSIIRKMMMSVEPVWMGFGWWGICKGAAAIGCLILRVPESGSSLNFAGSSGLDGCTSVHFRKDPGLASWWCFPGDGIGLNTNRSTNGRMMVIDWPIFAG
jgi:hypothetical protein